MNKLILFNFLFLSTLTAHADFFGVGDRNATIQNQLLLKGVPALNTFDGKNFAVTDKDLRDILGQKGTADVNTKAGVVQLSNSIGQYKMNWKNEDFERGLDLRLNQVLYVKENKDVESPAVLEVSTSTFDGKFLRSVTKCEGSQLKSASDNEVYCATATKQICGQVLKAYNRNETLRTPKTSAEESRKILDKKVSECMNTMTGYAEVLKAFSTTYEGNTSLKNAREDIVDQENKAVKEMLGGLSDKSWKPTSINSLKGEGHIMGSDYEKLAEKLTSSMRGLKQINDFVDLCADHQAEFGDGVDIRKAANKTSSESSTGKR